ncbi:MAG: DUF3341 domain-containing protein, partial [Planctomycetes bacterium]|nr:DUF3341 domain-containing protein [Planctomycetota bacterium]
GFAGMLWFQGWTSAEDWPLVIGGKETFALPAFIPVAFEAMVLSAAVCTLLALLIRSRLRPGKTPKLIDPRVTNDRFALVLLERDAAFNDAKADEIFDLHNAETRRWENIPGSEDNR